MDAIFGAGTNDQLFYWRDVFTFNSDWCHSIDLGGRRFNRENRIDLGGNYEGGKTYLEGLQNKRKRKTSYKLVFQIFTTIRH